MLQNKKRPSALKVMFTRRDAFNMLDVDKNLKISRLEYDNAHKPGASQKTISAYWTKMKVVDPEGMPLSQWLNIKTLSGISTYLSAADLREKRRVAFTTADAAGDNNQLLNFEEFKTLFKPKTSTKTFNSSWKTATGGKLPTEEITLPEFLRCSLSSSTVK